MRRASWLIALAIGCTTTLSAAAQQTTGSGSTFVYPIMVKWSAAYEKISGIHVEYQPIGSSGGITEIKAGVVDFGVSDAPLPPKQLARDGLAQFPVVIGAIVPVVNLDGIAPGQVRFTGALLADIYLGKVKNWNDPAVTALNPGINLPKLAITVIHRSDGSGTTFNWVAYLSKASNEWKTTVGANTSIAWPAGSGGKGNGGVADYVTHIKGAIGYVEFAYVLQKKLVYGLVQNRAGNFVQPGTTSFEAATQGVDWEKTLDFYVLLNDSPNVEAYPIVATSFVLIHKQPKDAERTRQTVAFFKWALASGQELATSLDYVPLPPTLVQRIEAYWQAQIQPSEK
jgi:phosphate transport system substrate-binding protein